MWKGVTIIARSKHCSLRYVNVVALVKLALEVRQAHHDGQVVPYVAGLKLQGLSHQSRRTKSGTRSFAAFDLEHSFAFETVKVLCETPAICSEVVSLNSEHEKRVDLIEGIQEAQKVSRVTMGSYGKEVAQRWWDEGGELLL